MNMHCLVAVARCRVQTRRYHCLINHIQSHRLTLCRLPLLAAPFSPCSARFSPFSALAAPRAARTRRVIPQNFPRAVLPRRVISLALLSSLPPPQSTHPLFPSRQPAAIDINLRNFFGASTCHRVTVHPRPDVPDAGAGVRGDAARGCNGGEGGASGRGRMRTKEAEGPNHRMVIRGHRAAIFETLIERINPGTSWPRN